MRLKNIKHYSNISALAIFSLAIFCASNFVLSKRHSHFIADDLQHFHDLITLTFWEYATKPIDVHFAPLHRLMTYFIFTLEPLNFNVALATMMAFWLVCVIFVKKLAYHLSLSENASWIIVLFIGASPFWIHNFIWWSSAAHRLPYLVLQAAMLLLYLRGRKSHKASDILLCCLMQIFALGFYIKAILFPVLIISIEACLAIRERSLSRIFIPLFITTSIISFTYFLWYTFGAHTLKFHTSTDALTMLAGAFHLLQRTSSALLLLPTDQYDSLWISSILWSSLIIFLLSRSPASALPLVLLTIIIIIDYYITIIGRGGLMLVHPYAAMRYYSDHLVNIAVFASISFSYMKESALQSKTGRNLFFPRLLFIAAICYPYASYFSSKHVVKEAYTDNKKTQKFMENVTRSLKKIQPAKEIVVISRDFPPYVFGFLGARLSMQEIMKYAYPTINWTTPNHASEHVYIVSSNGNIKPATFSSNPDYREDQSFPDWYNAEIGHRWSQNKQATILFSPQNNYRYIGEIVIDGPVLGEQHVNVSLNGHEIGKVYLKEGETCCPWSINFDASLIKKGTNVIEFELPDARQPGNGDQRVLAIGLRKIEIR